jgi:hypothetical protein
MNDELKITPHFKKPEMLVSEGFPDLAAEMDFTEEDFLKFRFLCGTTLEPCRMFVGYPFKVLSAKRSKELNRAIGGAENSQHLYSEAIDFTTPDSNDALWMAFNWIRKNCMYQTRRTIFYVDRHFIHVAMFPVSSGKDTEGPKFLYSLKGKYYIENPFQRANK